jgi:hypothetical protein
MSLAPLPLYSPTFQELSRMGNAVYVMNLTLVGFLNRTLNSLFSKLVLIVLEHCVELTVRIWVVSCFQISVTASMNLCLRQLYFLIILSPAELHDSASVVSSFHVLLRIKFC